MMELRHLRQFVALAEELHFGRAAARLHMTQPPLTMAIRQLEGLLGAELFVRTRRSVAISAAGEALLPRARRLLADAEQMGAAVRAAAQGALGRLRLGFVSTIGYGPLPGWLKGFRERYPGVELDLKEATLDVQLAAFESQEIDAGFVLHSPGSAPAGFERISVLREPLVLALPADHALAARTRVKADDLLGEPLVIFPRAISPSLYDAVLSFYRALGAAPHIAQEAIQMQTIVNLVSAGIGVAWVPETVTRLQRPGVAYRAVGMARGGKGAGPVSSTLSLSAIDKRPRSTGGSPQCETSLVWLKPQHPVVGRFVDHVRAHPSKSNSTTQGSR